MIHQIVSMHYDTQQVQPQPQIEQSSLINHHFFPKIVWILCWIIFILETSQVFFVYLSNPLIGLIESECKCPYRFLCIQRISFLVSPKVLIDLGRCESKPYEVYSFRRFFIGDVFRLLSSLRIDECLGFQFISVKVWPRLAWYSFPPSSLIIRSLGSIALWSSLLYLGQFISRFNSCLKSNVSAEYFGFFMVSPKFYFENSFIVLFLLLAQDYRIASISLIFSALDQFRLDDRSKRKSEAILVVTSGFSVNFGFLETCAYVFSSVNLTFFDEFKGICCEAVYEFLEHPYFSRIYCNLSKQFSLLMSFYKFHKQNICHQPYFY